MAKPSSRTRATGPTLIQRSRAVLPSAKASFHEIEGAGKSHIRRPFLGLTPADEDAIVAAFDDGLQRLLQKS